MAFIPNVGCSGIGWNSGVFVSGSGLEDSKAFGAWRGRPIDNLLFFPGRDSWSGMAWVADELDAFGGLRILALPTQPESMDNTSTANGDNDQWWRDYGTMLTGRGYNVPTTVLRLNWEANGTFTPWAYSKPSAAAFIAAIKNVVTAVRSTAPNVLISMCLNKGSRITGIDWANDIFEPLLGYYDICSLDWYNHGTLTFEKNLTEEPGGPSVVAFCRANGLLYAEDEWAVSHGVPGSYAGGGDDPAWIIDKWAWFKENSDILAYESYFNTIGDPPTRHHSLTDGTNPKAAAAYRDPRRWGV
jgi:hypothetical protein